MYSMDSLNMEILGAVGMNGDLKKYRNYTRLVAVLDVLLATLGFFFNPFNDEETDVPFLYWKITVTCLIFEIWMIVSINLFVATQKLETQQNPKKSIKYCNYWLTIATLAFIVFQAIIVFPPPANASNPSGAFGTNPMLSNNNNNNNKDDSSSRRQQFTKRSPFMEVYWPTGILIYRIFATLIVIKYKGKLRKYSNNNNTVVSNPLQEFDLDLDGDGDVDLTDSLNDPAYLSAMASAYPDLLTHAVVGSDGSSAATGNGKCNCGNSLISNENETGTGNLKQSQKYQEAMEQEQLQHQQQQGINFYLNPSNNYLMENCNPNCNMIFNLNSEQNDKSLHSNNYYYSNNSQSQFFPWNRSVVQSNNAANNNGAAAATGGTGISGLFPKLNFTKNKVIRTDAHGNGGNNGHGNGNKLVQSVQV